METGPAPMRTSSSTTSTNDDGFRRIEVITGVGRRRRWTEEEKAWIVAESLDPATSVSAVARRYGLHASQLFVWRQQRGGPRGGGVPPPGGPAPRGAPGPAGRPRWWHLQRPGPAAERAVVGHRQVEPEQAEDGADQALSLA